MTPKLVAQSATSAKAPTQIEDSELAYLRRLASEQQMANAALQKFVDHLSQRYQLTQADAIDLSGKITRKGQV